MMIRRLYSRHTPKDLEEYRDLSEKDIKKMSNQEKFDFLDDEYDKAGRNEFRYGKKKFKKQVKNATNGARHQCYICKRTELDDSNLEFRFCSKCGGNHEYCQDHLFTHIHIK